MLEVEDFACTVDDMGARDRSGSLVQRGLSEGRRDKDTRGEMMEVHCRTQGQATRFVVCLSRQAQSCLSQMDVKGK